MKTLLFAACCTITTMAFAAEPSKPGDATKSAESYEIPESEFQKRDDLESFEDIINEKTRENEEWSALSFGMEQINAVPEATNSDAILLGYLERIQTYMNATDYEEQYHEEQRLLDYLNFDLLPELLSDFKYGGGTQEGYETHEVRAQVAVLAQSIRAFYNVVSSNRMRSPFFYPNRSNARFTADDVRFKTVDDLNNFKEQVDTALKELKKTFVTSSDHIQKTIKSNEEEIKAAKDKRNKILAAANKKTDINMWAIWLGIPAFCLTILLLYLIPEWFFRGKESRNYGILLELITVLLLTMTILILGLSGKLGEEVLGTLIGGISAYVLNKAATIRKTAKAADEAAVLQQFKDQQKSND